MQIVVFGAYKAGVGRTYAAVSIANALARCGVHVVLVDMDVDAPSVPSLYGHSVWAADGAPWVGLVPWAVAAGATKLESHVTTVYDAEGSLRILPAGPLGPQYQDALLTKQWRDLFEINPRGFVGHLTASMDDWNRPPDVVLIDARAGLGPISGALLTMQDATVAFFFAGDVDSVRVAQGLRDQVENGDRRVVPVLSRYPTFLTGGMARVQETIKEYIKEPDRLLFLPAAPGHEGLTRSTIGLQLDYDDAGDPVPENIDTSSPLAVDHVRMLRELLPQVQPPDEAVDPALAAVFNEARAAPRLHFKIFRDVATGHMINPADQKRNVAFKVETIQAVFEQIRIRMAEAGMDSRTLDGALIEGGRQAGNAFGRALADSLAIEGPEERLTAWCAFDTEVGFGHLFVNDDPPVGISYEVRISDPFLPRHGGGSKVLEGYVIGVLCQILDEASADEANLRWDESGSEVQIAWDTSATQARVHWDNTTLVADVTLAASAT